MNDIRLGPIETRFANLIWDNEPLSSGALVKLCEQALRWKKSTTYTVLRRLCQRGLFQNDGGTVRSLLSKNDFYALQSETFVQETFEGSLPRFLAAFSSRKKLSDQEIDALQKFIDERRGVTCSPRSFRLC